MLFSGTTRIASGGLVLNHVLALQDSALDLDGGDAGTFSFAARYNLLPLAA